MNVNIYGFSFEKSKKPENLSISDIFKQLSLAQGAFDAGKLFKIAVAELTQKKKTDAAQYGGMILRFRDAKSFNKYSDKGGKVTLSAETLDGNDKLVEMSFFVVNQESGSGLITHYQNAPSIINLGFIVKRCLREISDEKIKAINENESLSSKEQKNEKKKYRGSLEIEQICLTDNLKSLVKDLKKVTACELQLKSVKTTDTFFRGLATQSKRQSIKFHMSEGAVVSEIADEAAIFAEKEEIKEIKVSGKDAKNQTKIYRKTENALYFESYDYDSMMTNFELDLSQWNNSIASSSIITTLQSLSQTDRNKVLLR